MTRGPKALRSLCAAQGLVLDEEVADYLAAIAPDEEAMSDVLVRRTCTRAVAFCV